MGKPSAEHATENDILIPEVDPSELRYMPLDYLRARPNPRNPKDHDLGDIMASILRHGFVGYVTFDPSIEMMVVGHGRLDALTAMRDDGYDPPERIETIGDSWMVPTHLKIFANQHERDAYTIGDNQTTIKGGWLIGDLTAMLEGLHKEDPERGLVGTGFDEDRPPIPAGGQGFRAAAPPPPPPPQIQTRYGVLVQVSDKMQEEALAGLLIRNGWEKFLRLSEDE
jgi:hypothetical protein